MSFEQLWKSAQYNEFFWLSHVCGISGVALLLACALLIKNTGLRRFLYCAVILTICVFVTPLTVMSVQEKWRLRMEGARTEQEREAVCMRDGANLAFSPIIGGFKSIAYAGVGLLFVTLARRTRSFNARRRLQRWIYPIDQHHHH
jgi:hypothetical protein